MAPKSEKNVAAIATVTLNFFGLMLVKISEDSPIFALFLTWLSLPCAAWFEVRLFDICLPLSVVNTPKYVKINICLLFGQILMYNCAIFTHYLVGVFKHSPKVSCKNTQYFTVAPKNSLAIGLFVNIFPRFGRANITLKQWFIDVFMPLCTYLYRINACKG